MSIRFQLCIALFCAVISMPIAFAVDGGGASTGGGGAFVCRDANGKIQESHFLDLWEAVKLRKWPVPESNLPVDVQIEMALWKLHEKVSPHYYRLVREALYKIRLNTQDLPEDISIAPPSDAAQKYFKTGCPMEGMMLYDGEINALSRKREIYDALVSNTQKAAAEVHEAVYWVLREVTYRYHWQQINDPTSIRSRRLVGCLFSSDPNCLQPDVAPVPLAEDPTVYHCRAENLDFYTYKISKDIYESDGQSHVSIKYVLQASRFFQHTFPNNSGVASFYLHWEYPIAHPQAEPASQNMGSLFHSTGTDGAEGMGWNFSFGLVNFGNMSLRIFGGINRPIEKMQLISAWDPGTGNLGPAQPQDIHCEVSELPKF